MSNTQRDQMVKRVIDLIYDDDVVSQYIKQRAEVNAQYGDDTGGVYEHIKREYVMLLDEVIEAVLPIEDLVERYIKEGVLERKLRGMHPADRAEAEEVLRKRGA